MKNLSKNRWIVSGTTKDGKCILVSSREVGGMLPIGSYLTVTDDDGINHILFVEQSYSQSLFEPSPMIVDTGLPIMKQDQECRYIVVAQEIKQFPEREDGLFSGIKPNETGRRTSQEEIDKVFTLKEGYPVFLATSFLRENPPFRDESGTLIHVRIPFDSLYLQTMICGQTGSGKTVAMKYIIEQFLGHEKGTVLAINVKSADLLTMDQQTKIGKEDLRKRTQEEWDSLGLNESQIGVFRIYVPFSGIEVRYPEMVSRDRVSYITLKTRNLEPNSLLGILQNVTDRAAEALPSIFRYWKRQKPEETDKFGNFINWFNSHATKEEGYEFPTISQTGVEANIPIHPSTCGAIRRSLGRAVDFFDSPESFVNPIGEQDIMVKGKLSVIDLANKDTTIFGAVLLRHLISRIYEAKAVRGEYPDIPVLIIIDEVHQFYGTTASAEALEELNAIARMGRSNKIGVVFASQNPQDLPKGITSIVNTRIFFRSLENVGRSYGMRSNLFDLSTLKSGYGAMSTVTLPGVTLVKFPMALKGVISQ